MMLSDLFEPVQLGVLPGKPYLHGAADTRPCGHPSLQADVQAPVSRVASAVTREATYDAT